MRYNYLLLLVLLIISLECVMCQNAGIWFCNFYPSQTPLSVFANRASDFVAGQALYLVSYPDCKYLANFAPAGGIVKITARTAHPGYPVSGLGDYGQFLACNLGTTNSIGGVSCGTPYGQSFTLVTAPNGQAQGQVPELNVNQPWGILQGGAGNPDGDNHNIIIARPTSNDPQVSTFILESMVPPFIVRNRNVGAFQFNPLIQNIGRVRNIVVNYIPPTGFPFNVLDNRNNAVVPYFLGNLDCYNVGPPGYGSLGPFNDVIFTTYQGAHVVDRPAVSFNSIPDPVSQWVQCFVADSFDNAGTMIGQPFLITGTHPVNSITLTALHGYGSAQYPFATAQFTFSGATRQTAQLAQNGLVSVTVTPTQALTIQAMLVAGTFNSATKLTVHLAYLLPIVSSLILCLLRH